MLLEGLKVLGRRPGVLADDQETLFQVPDTPTPLKVGQERLGCLRLRFLRLSAMTHRETFSTIGIAPYRPERYRLRMLCTALASSLNSVSEYSSVAPVLSFLVK